MGKKHDFFVNLRDRLVKGCSLCGGSGYGSNDARCECLSRLEMCYDLDEAGIDREYWDFTWENWKGDALVKKKVVEYIENLNSAYENGLGMVFYGANGRGKTFCSTMILKAALEKGKSIRFITMGELSALFKKKIGNEEGEESFYEDRVKNADFLCLDNLGSEYRPQNFGSYTLAEFDLLARHRRRNLLPTILTTNESKESFITLYGSSIGSLFTACSLFIEVCGGDFRQTQGKQYSDKLRDL